MRTLLLVLTIPALILLATMGQGKVISANQTTNVCPANPSPATPDFNQVDTPTAGDRVSSPVSVRGRIAAFEATFKIKIFDAGGNVLADVTGMSSEGQTLAL
jgi:Immunoglobulin-like domain of bacterial spore germination